MKLFRREPEAEADVRPTLLGVVTLMFLLLFFLLATSSGQRLGVVDLRLAAPGEAPPLPHAGLVKSVVVTLEPTAARVEFEVATTDISSSADTRELRAIDVPAAGDGVDLAALLAAMESIHRIDGSQDRAEVRPSPGVSTTTLLAVLDVVRGPTQAPLFPRVSLQ